MITELYRFKIQPSRPWPRGKETVYLNDDFELWLINLRAERRKIPPIKDWNRVGLINFLRGLFNEKRKK